MSMTKISPAVRPLAIPSRFPVAFGDCAGWLHEGRARTGVVLCGAQGFEALCTRQSMHVLADRIAEQGPDVLRFDWPGEGDSLDSDVDENSTDSAVGSIRQAVDWLRRERGATRIVLVGLRLGALYALEAARSGLDLAAVVLIAPPATGTAYAREMKATARLLGTSKMGCAVTGDSVELCGFLSGPEQLKALSALKPGIFSPAPLAMLAEPLERPCDGLADALESAGVAVERTAFEGCADMLASPTAGVIPHALFEQIAAWLAQPAAGGTKAPVVSRALSGDGFCEDRVQFGADGALAGVLCRPEGGRQPHQRTVVMLNAGAISHIGWARMSVDQARLLARQGVASLRMDLSGIGDSTWRTQSARRLLYSPQHIADVGSALDYLDSRGHGNFVLVGLCAGGYAALHAAHRDRRVVAALPVNVDKFVWHDHYDIDVIEQELNQSASSYATQAFTGTAWKRVLSGDVSAQRIVAILKLLSKKAMERMVDPLGAAVGLERGLSEDDRFIRSVFADLAGRGTRVGLVFADRDPGVDELDRHMGVQARFLRAFPQISIDVIEDADHEFTPLAAREALARHLLDIVLGERTMSRARAA